MTNAILEFFGRDPVTAWSLIFAGCAVIAGIAVACYALHCAPREK